MAKIKQMDIVAEEMATDILEEIYKHSDWQIGQFLPESCEGDEYNDAHSYLVKLVARHIAIKTNVITNQYYDE